MITVYHSPRSRSMRVVWLLEELGVPYALERIEFKPSVLRGAEHLARHPLGQLPVIEDDGEPIFESGAILQHIMETHGDGGLLPAPATLQRARCWQWFHFGEATLAKHVGEIVRNTYSKPEAKRIPAAAEDARARYRAAVSVLERALEGKRFVLGDAFSAADIMLGYPLMLGRLIHELPAEYAVALSYLKRLRERPAYQRSIAD